MEEFCFGAVIPANRMANWSTAGVVGGIPNNRVEYANAAVAGCDTNGQVDCSAILQQLGNSCPPNEYVYLPPGNYLIANRINASSWNHRSLVGAGMGKTILHFSGGAYILAGSDDWPVPTPNVNIIGGNLAGSTNLVVDSTVANITAVGKLVTITQVNPDWVHVNTDYYGSSGPSGCGHGPDRLMAFTTRTLAVTSSSVTIADPLPTSFTNAPAITPWNQHLLQGFGIQNLTLNMTNSSAKTAVLYIQTYNCWLDNVEIAWPLSRFVWFNESSHDSMVNCYTHHSRGAGPNSEGIDLSENVCFSLIQGNVCNDAGFPMIILGDFSGGNDCNVIAYNYMTNAISGEAIVGTSISVNHGPHNMFNLAEGNVGQDINSDGYYGSASHNTIFRNWFSGVFSADYLGSYCIGLTHWSRWFNVVGNVLGSPGYSQVLFQTGTGYQSGAIYVAGYPSIGNRHFNGVYADNPSNADAIDTGVTNTWIRTGNYDYVNNKTSWDSNGVQTLPASLYLMNKPAWWTNYGNSSPWPPIGPDVAGLIHAIPAEVRFAQLTDPNSTGTNAPPPVVPEAPSGLRVVGP